MEITILVAVDDNYGIGKDNKLLKRLPDDLTYFRKVTTGHIVLMGRKTYESIPEKFRPLPGRINIVITKQTDYVAPGCIIANSIQEALDINNTINKTGKCFVIGGGEIYKHFLENNLVNQVIITHINGSYDADVFFPILKTPLVSSKVVVPHPEYTIKRYVLKSP